MTATQLDFTQYPYRAGSKTGGTSAEAARDTDASRLRQEVLKAFRDHGPMTADEAAGVLGLSVLSVRPRCSELVAFGRLVKTPQRRKNESGKAATVLEAQ